MKVTGWTYWEDGRYRSGPDYESDDTYSKAWEVIVKEIRERGYKFSGIYHQGGMTGVPIIDNEWVFIVSQRTWGQIIAEAYPDEIDNSDGYGYTAWAWKIPDGEEMVIPKEDEYE